MHPVGPLEYRHRIKIVIMFQLDSVSFAATVAAALAAAAAVAVAEASSSPTSSNFETITRLTAPLPLRPGEVTNSFHKLPIPPGPIAIYEFKADVVEKDADGNVVPVSLSDAYLHHHVVFSEHEAHERQKHWWSPMKPPRANRGVGFGAGTESRGTPQKFAPPFAFVTVEGEDELLSNVHVINTRDMPTADASHCLECPCTSSDVFPSNGTILGSVASRRRNWDECNAELLDEGNTACRPDTYYGGLVCCEDGEFCMDEYDPAAALYDGVKASGPVSTYYLRYTLTYATATEDNIPLYLAACCDASGNETSSGNVEYDIPELCDAWDSLDGTDDDDYDDDDRRSCVHELSTVQILHGSSFQPFGVGDDLDEKADEEGTDVDVVYMVGHLHRGGLDITATDESTGEVICRSVPAYGTGGEIGNERGYINGMSTCVFDPPRRMRTTDPIRITSSYDARQAHTGVMGLFYIALADVNAVNANEEERRVGGVPVTAVMQWAGVGAVLAVMAVAGSRYAERTKRRDYEMVPARATAGEGVTTTV